MNIKDEGKDNRITVDKSVQAGQLLVTGSGNEITIAAGCRLQNARFEIAADGCTVHIGASCVLIGEFVLKERDTALTIGEKTTMMGAKITMHEAGRIRIGRDCMFAGQVRMDTSDMHSILDAATGERLNPPGDVLIGDHVWLGFGVYVLKGVQIGQDCVVGAGSIVADDLAAGSLAAGVPARVLRTGVTWDRRRLPMKATETPAAVPRAKLFNWWRGR
ncbi:acyltransferase [Ideonella livida]|uniref:Acyltransferase n=1 Tax=Ideonella livida TaxID=2707176 RepID=A0A7C9PGE8_9BURK|nr:acyltransferase [Ideonella livida]NDY91009.1 acyltransferase [Ideonella livida]